MVPEGWKLCPIREVCEAIIDCVNKTAPTVEQKTPYKMIRTPNVRNGRVDTENVRYVTKETYDKWVRRGKPQINDLVLTREAPVGEVGLLKETKGVFLGQRTILYRANRKKANSLFLLYSLQSPYCQKQIDNFSNGGTVAHMRVPDCGEIVIKLPPLQEQNRIAEILSVWDKAIETVEKLIENSRQQKKALMQQLLKGSVRFPECQKPWEAVSFSEIAEINPGKPNRPEDGDVSFVSMNDVSEEAKLLSTQVRQYSDVDSGFTAFKDHDVLIAKITPCFENGKGAYVKNLKNGIGFGSTEFHVLRARDNMDARFIYYLTNTREFRIRAEANMQGSAGQKRVPTDYIKNYRVRVPSDPQEQTKISDALAAVDSEINNCRKQLKILLLEKRALMQKLLTGQLRVAPRLREKEPNAA